jgi:hypothetical protein
VRAPCTVPDWVGDGGRFSLAREPAVLAFPRTTQLAKGDGRKWRKRANLARSCNAAFGVIIKPPAGPTSALELSLRRKAELLLA